MRDTTTAGALAGRLDGRRNGTGWLARCPAHEDERASLSIGEGEDGRVLLKCFAGCELDAILGKLGIAARDLFPPREATAKPKSVATYDYTAETGELLYQVVRYEPKDFRQRRPDGAGGWTWRLDGVSRVLFRLSRVLAAAKAGGVVYITEGEKDVLALEAVGLLATTNAGGAGKWRAEYSEAFNGCKGAAILPDNDDPGRKHAQDVARSLHAVGIPAKVVELPGLPPKGDVSDWLAAGGTKEALVNLAKVAPRWKPPASTDGKPSTSVLVRLDTVKVERVSWLWPGRYPFAKVTVLDGDPGMGKSAQMVDIAARVTRGYSMPGETVGREPAGVVILTAEDGLADTIRPRLEAAGGDPSRVVALDAIRLDSGACRMPTLADIENIREAIVSVGAKLVIIDPIMAYLGTKDGHKDQDVRSIAHPVAHLAEETGVAVVLIRHLTKTEKANPLYRGGGSIGIAGAARSVLLVAPDRNDPNLRILASVKSNLSAPPPSLSYRLVADGDVVRVQWEGVVDVTAAALLASHGTDDEAGGLAGAEAFLREMLAEGPAPSKDVFAQARQAGISEITVKRAKAALGAKAHKAGGRFGGDPSWYWELPEGDHAPLKGITREHDPLQAQMIPFSRGEAPPRPTGPDPADCPRCGSDTCPGDCPTPPAEVIR